MSSRYKSCLRLRRPSYAADAARVSASWRLCRGLAPAPRPRSHLPQGSSSAAEGQQPRHLALVSGELDRHATVRCRLGRADEDPDGRAVHEPDLVQLDQQGATVVRPREGGLEGELELRLGGDVQLPARSQADDVPRTDDPRPRSTSCHQRTIPRQRPWGRTVPAVTNEMRAVYPPSAIAIISARPI